jgi:hypothetical protein
MAEREVLVLNETDVTVEVPQTGDTYSLPKDVSITGDLTVSGSVTSATNGDTAVSGTLDVTGAATFGSTVGITGAATAANVVLSSAPTSDPGTSGQIWNDSGIARVSDGTGTQTAFQTSGDFTPTILDSSLDPNEGQTYGDQVGHYVKTGDLVWFTLRVEVTSVGTLNTSEGIKIGGLPFSASADDPDGISVFPVFCAGTNLTATGQSIQARIVAPGDDYLRLYWWDNAFGPTPITFAEADAGGAFNFYVTGTYKAG